MLMSYRFLDPHATSPLSSSYITCLKKLLVGRKGVDIAPCPPSKYATGPRLSRGSGVKRWVEDNSLYFPCMQFCGLTPSRPPPRLLGRCPASRKRPECL